MNRREVRRARAMDRLTQRADVDVTPHALARIDELGFSLVEVLECVMRPEQTYCSHPDYGPGRRTYQRGALAVVLHEQTRTVVTVLLRRPERWEHGRDVVRPQSARSRAARVPAESSAQ